MFDRLSDRFSSVLRSLSGKGSISESNVRDAMADVRAALIEADVALDVVDSFCSNVLADSLGRKVTQSLQPGQEMIGIVYDRLVELLGDAPPIPPDATPEEAAKILMQEGPGILQASPGPTVIMLCGLQGSGKTTTAGKLAGFLKKRGRSVLLVAADLQRPAAIEQLHTVADTAERDLSGGAAISFYGEPDKAAAYGKAVGVAVQVCQRGVNFARSKGIDTVILDTAGRLHVNDDLMGELAAVKNAIRPHQIYLVVDAMTGQDAVRSSKAFHDKLSIEGLILTKFDSDTRGGAALSVKSVTGAPIRFVGVGEKLDALEQFHASRFAGRILGMGDVLSLVEKAREQVNEDEARKLEEKLAKGEMTMDDFLGQLRSIRRMGPLKNILGMLPGVGSALKNVQIEDKQLDRVEGIINSMTRHERTKPSVINHSRRKRIAAGAGVKVDEVNSLVKQVESLGQLTKHFATMSAADKVKAVKSLSASGQADGDSAGGMGGLGGMMPNIPGLPGFGKKGSTVSSKPKGFKKRK